MSEELQPQDSAEEKTAETETQDLQLETQPPQPEDEPSEEPQEPKVFGLPVVTFRCMAAGFGVGLILAGVLGLSSSYIPMILCTGAGWLVGRELEKRRKNKTGTN